MTTMSVQNLVDKTGISRYLVTKALNELHIEIGHHQTKISESQMAKLEATFKAIKAGNKALKTRPAAKPKAAKPKAAKPAVTKPAAKPKAMKPLAKTAKPAATGAKPAAKPMAKPAAKPAAKPMAKVDAKPAASALKPEANSAPKLQDTDGLHD